MSDGWKRKRARVTAGPMSSRGRVFLQGCAGLLTLSLAAGCGSGVSSVVPAAGTKTAAGVPGGPMLGFVWSASDATLRPLLGVLGSGLVGQSIVPAGTYVTGAASSATDIGLVEDESGSLYLLNLPTPTVALAATGVPVPARIVFSPLGRVAVAYAPGGSSVTLVSGLTGQPVSAKYTLPAGATLAAAAVSDVGTVLVATQTSPVRIETLSAAGQPALVATVGQMGGMSFFAGTEDALVADAGASTVLRATKVSSSGGVQTLSSSGVNRPGAVAVSRDGSWGLVANGGDASFVRLDLKSGTPNTKMTCLCQPNQASVLAGGKAFRLNDVGSGPVWVADLSTTAPQLIFVPALQ